jgi:hypothetical protein
VASEAAGALGSPEPEKINIAPEANPAEASPSAASVAASVDSPSSVVSESGIISIDKSGLYNSGRPPKKDLPKEMLSELGVLMYGYMHQVSVLAGSYFHYLAAFVIVFSAYL